MWVQIIKSLLFLMIEGFKSGKSRFMSKLEKHVAKAQFNLLKKNIVIILCRKQLWQICIE